MVNKSTHKKKVKIQKDIAMMSLTASGIEEAEEEIPIKITPFSVSIGDGEKHPHVDTITKILTTGYLWQNIFIKYDLKFFVDSEGFVVGFIKKQKKDVDELKILQLRMNKIEEKQDKMFKRIEETLKEIKEKK